MRAGLLLFLALGACSPREWKAADGATFATALAATVCDAGGTYRASTTGWSVTEEGNMLLGHAPEPGTVALYFATTLTAELVAYELLPKRYGVAAFGGVAAAESYQSAHNAQQIGVCGL